MPDIEMEESKDEIGGNNCPYCKRAITEMEEK
jgi:hypothetical protein